MASRNPTINLSSIGSDYDYALLRIEFFWPSGTYNGTYVCDLKINGTTISNENFNIISTNAPIANLSNQFYGWAKRWDNNATYGNTIRRLVPWSTTASGAVNTSNGARYKVLTNSTDNKRKYIEVIKLYVGRSKTNRYNSLNVTVDNPKYDGTKGDWYNSNSITLTTSTIPEPTTPTITYSTSGNDGYGNPTTVIVSTSCNNPENWYTLTLEKSDGTVLATSKSGGPITHTYSLNASTYDRTWSFRGRIAGGGINKSSSLLNIFHATPTLPIWYFLPNTGVRKQVMKMVYFDNTGTARKVLKVYANQGGIFK